MKDRIVTGAVLLFFALATVFVAWTPVAYAIIALLAILGGRELGSLKLSFNPPKGTASMIAVGLVALLLPAQLAAPLVGLGAGLLIVPGLFGEAAAVMWLGGGLAGLRALAASHPGTRGLFDPAPIVLIALVPVWAADTAAYFGGRLFGRTPLAPKISPKKTLEGVAFGLAGALAAALLLASWLRVPIATAALIGLAAGTLGPAGDLLESLLKRRVNAKDSGTLLPGHGGVLDRIDSLLLVAPLAAALLLR